MAIPNANIHFNAVHSSQGPHGKPMPQPQNSEDGVLPKAKGSGTMSQETTQFTNPYPDQDVPPSPDFTSLPPLPASPKGNMKHSREASKSFFSNLKASKSSNRVHQVEPTIRQVSDDVSQGRPDVSETHIYSMNKSTGSTPDLNMSAFGTSPGDKFDDSEIQEKASARRPSGPTVMSDTALVTISGDAQNGKKNKPRFAHLLTRTRSMRMDDGGRRSKPATPIMTSGLGGPMHAESNGEPMEDIRTAPLQQEKDRTFRDMMGSAIRNRSADRQPSPNRRTNPPEVSQNEPQHGHTLGVSASQVFHHGPGAHLITNLKKNSTRAADGLGKAGKGFFGKITRSGSSNAREVADDEPYVCSVINLPLVEQTRLTRIAKRLEDSKDKTEFWMPALPWRCIDYLNFRGCEEEGLYRIPGSGPKIKEWQKRFDKEGDINLFNEPELYDINIIGSMFKAWLRDLPTEILPKETQAMVARECAGAKEVPQLLKDELSKLPPWNYYLLFATTCHLSLLHAYVDKNKMNYGNLCICFQPCLRIDAFCFQFLVCDWRNCWQGCWTEKAALDEERQIIDRLNSSGGESSSGSTAIGEERSLQSAGSTILLPAGRGNERRPPPLSLTRPSEERPSTPTRHEMGHNRSESHLPELQPMMPLSPIGISGL